MPSSDNTRSTADGSVTRSSAWATLPATSIDFCVLLQPSRPLFPRPDLCFMGPMSFWKHFITDKSSQPAAVALASAAPRGRAAATFAARLTFENVERRYGEGFALRGLTLDIAPGEVVCLLGPSGCGKTTLLRITSGIEKPSGGRVLINDREVAGPNRSRAARGTRRRFDVSGFCAVPTPHDFGERSVRAEGAAPRGGQA